jgi:hypothetical protein
MTPFLSNRWAKAWTALTVAFALHVWDEAANDFLALYNPNAEALRRQLGVSWFPPTFTFRGWLTGLCVAVILLAALTPLLRRRRAWLIALAYVYGVIHVLNGLGHITVSVVGRWLAPGILSSPLVIASAVWLLIETDRMRRSASESRNGAPGQTNEEQRVDAS